MGLCSVSAADAIFGIVGARIFAGKNILPVWIVLCNGDDVTNYIRMNALHLCQSSFTTLNMDSCLLRSWWPCVSCPSPIFGFDVKVQMPLNNRWDNWFIIRHDEKNCKVNKKWSTVMGIIRKITLEINILPYNDNFFVNLINII